MKSEAPAYRETSEPGSDVIILIHSFDSYEGLERVNKVVFSRKFEVNLVRTESLFHLMTSQE